MSISSTLCPDHIYLKNRLYRIKDNNDINDDGLTPKRTTHNYITYIFYT